ncbi:MAG TPA: aryl-sulfate sulfotransferase [Candidatus Coprosoma intestinipullorum]|uniref:Aryl-sulfate sulfotransferase n=1 Tax=Candidatus Coprosoma intestinipullorum TaxID=2840752 RepID=A0A9D0ZTZ5_9FIRM|nr:aryl-sulfate sulfotransferase [Candidatus Coprosoma intestinipullorum]
MNKKTVIVLVAAVVVVIIAVFRIFGMQTEGENEVENVVSLMEKQIQDENKLEISGYTLDDPNVVLNPYEISPLTALVIFETDEEVSPEVTIHGDSDLTTYTHTFAKGTEHYLPIYGLYAGRENKVTIKCGDEEKELTIKTDEHPDDFILPTSVKKDESKLSNDLYFYTPSSSGYTAAYDVNGDVRWYLTESAIWEINRLDNGRLLVSTERLAEVPYYSTGLYEMDMLGKIYTEYSLPGGYHHDYYEMENGNLLVASDDFNNDSGTVEDYVVEIDRKTGNIVKTFDLKDILKMTDGKSENWIEYDWFHNNSVWYDKKTNSITLSGRHQDAVINIDYDTGKLNWILGDPEGWSDEYQKYFFKPVGDNFEWQWSQHAAMITPEGYVFLFDNGNNKSKNEKDYVKAEDSYSRGVMYKIDTDKMTIEQVWEYGKERGSDFYSPYISDVDYLDKNHYIVHSGGISYKDGKIQNQPAGLAGADTLKSDTVELLNNEVIFEMILPTNNYRVEKMSLYSDDEFELGVSRELGSLGVTDTEDEKFTLMSNAKEQDDDYKSHDISIKKEKDRLAVTGTFKRGTEVKIILYKDMMEKIYNMRISTRPYTALCVDLGNNNDSDDLTVTKYINSDGLIGKYTIFIEIDGVIYQTDEYVSF